jgi:hypothetical protein
MADQLPLATPDPNADPAAQGTTAPVAQAAPAQAAAVQKPKKHGQQQQQGKRKGIIEIPEAAFKARVQREAAAEIRRRTGVTIEEAERLIKAGGTVAAGGGKTAATNTADAAVIQLRAENEKLRKSNEKLTREGGQAVKKLEKRLRNSNDARVEAELRADARMAGITDPDYAITLFARAVGKDGTLQPETFFAGLKATHAHLFVAAAPAPALPKVVVAPTTTPPESQATGEVKPKAATAGDPVAEKHSEQDSPQEFAARQRSYGYVPGM